MMPDVLNIDCFSGPKGVEWRNRALGVTVVDGERMMNGGIVNPQREHLRLGQYYYRFVSLADAAPAKATGAWWIDFDTLNSIYGRFRQTGPSATSRRLHGSGPAASTFREWLAVTYGWNSLQEIVIGRLVARLDAFTGAGRPARGTHVFDTRSFGYAPHLSNLFTIKQLCIPDLRVHQKVAFPQPRIVPFAQLDEVVSGRIG